VRGRVLDANGNGIANAMVMAAPAGSTSGAVPTSSDVNGTFVVTAPADGPIDLAAVAPGFPPARANGVQPQDGVDVVLRAPRPGHVRVNVLDTTGHPVTGVYVAYHAVPDFLGSWMSFGDRAPATGSDGATTLASMGPGAYELTATLGPRKGTGSVTVTEGSEVVTTVTLP
jgi:protocatechuate 3,4-dioxygenase beta subunit